MKSSTLRHVLAHQSRLTNKCADKCDACMVYDAACDSMGVALVKAKRVEMARRIDVVEKRIVCFERRFLICSSD